MADKSYQVDILYHPPGGSQKAMTVSFESSSGNLNKDQARDLAREAAEKELGHAVVVDAVKDIRKA